MEFDDLLLLIGEFGRYQILVYILLCLLNCSSAIYQIAIVFIAAAPSHWCRVAELEYLLHLGNVSQSTLWNLTLPQDESTSTGYSQCTMYARDYTNWTADDVTTCLTRPDTCNTSEVTACGASGWAYDSSQYVATITTDFDLVCERQWLRAASTSVYAAGFMTGGLLFGSLADVIGRKGSFCVAFTAQVAFNIGMSFAPNIAAFLTLRFLAAFCDQLYYTSLIVALEIVGPKWRDHVGVIVIYFWAFGYMMTPGFAYLLRDWRTLQFTVSACTCVFFAYFWLLPESPRWLYTMGRHERADSIVVKMAKCNGTSFDPSTKIIVKDDKPSEREYMWHLIKAPNLRWKFFNLCFNYFVNSLVYYGFSLNSPNYGGDDYLNTFLAGAVELPATVICHLIVLYLGRRWPYVACMLFGGALLLATIAVPRENVTLLITLSMIGKGAITITFTIIAIVTVEIMPTTVRKVGSGFVVFVGSFGGMSAAYVYQLYNIFFWLPASIGGSLSIVAGLLALALPEVAGTHLPETVREGDGLEKKPDSNAIYPEYENNSYILTHDIEDTNISTKL